MRPPPSRASLRQTRAASLHPAADQDTSPGADAFPVPRIGDLRAQPLFAEDAPLQPSFSMPTGWLTESPVPASADAPRRRAPADEFFFDDDATPARWASSSGA